MRGPTAGVVLTVTTALVLTGATVPVNVFLLHDPRPGNVTCPGVPLPNETEVHPARSAARLPWPWRRSPRRCPRCARRYRH